MTRKDYVAIAAALASVDPLDWPGDLGQRVARNAIRYCAEAIADVMARDNPRFDRERFLKAAGVQS